MHPIGPPPVNGAFECSGAVGNLLDSEVFIAFFQQKCGGCIKDCFPGGKVAPAAG